MSSPADVNRRLGAECGRARLRPSVIPPAWPGFAGGSGAASPSPCLSPSGPGESSCFTRGRVWLARHRVSRDHLFRALPPEFGADGAQHGIQEDLTDGLATAGDPRMAGHAGAKPAAATIEAAVNGEGCL